MKKTIKKKKAPVSRRGISKKATKRVVKFETSRNVTTLENDVELGYQPHRVGAALPWDHSRRAVHADWAKLSQDVGPRDSSRGIRSGF